MESQSKFWHSRLLQTCDTISVLPRHVRILHTTGTPCVCLCGDASFEVSISGCHAYMMDQLKLWLHYSMNIWTTMSVVRMSIRTWFINEMMLTKTSGIALVLFHCQRSEFIVRLNFIWMNMVREIKSNTAEKKTTIFVSHPERIPLCTKQNIFEFDLLSCLHFYWFIRIYYSASLKLADAKFAKK